MAAIFSATGVARGNVMRILLVMVGVLVSNSVPAGDLLPLHHGRYSSSSCDQAANAALLFFDGKSLNGAHSQACTMSLVKKTGATFVVTQTCPAEQVGSSVPARLTTLTETIHVKTSDSFELSTSRDDEIRNYRFCSKK
jgi:hypothetical protein